MSNPLACTSITATCTVESSIYGYRPNVPATAFFLVFFAICTVLNLVFGIRYRTWTYMIAMGLGSLAQTIGYIGRLFMHKNPFDFIAFEVALCCVTIAPAFNAAAIYLTLKHITLCFGPEFAQIRPAFYTYLFILADVLALVMQAIGGAMAASARKNPSLAETGNNLLIAGISWQVPSPHPAPSLPSSPTLLTYHFTPQASSHPSHLRSDGLGLHAAAAKGIGHGAPFRGSQSSRQQHTFPTLQPRPCSRLLGHLRALRISHRGDGGRLEKPNPTKRAAVHRAGIVYGLPGDPHADVFPPGLLLPAPFQHSVDDQGEGKGGWTRAGRVRRAEGRGFGHVV